MSGLAKGSALVGGLVVVGLAWDCGGQTSSPIGGADASLDSTSESGSSSSSSGSSGSSGSSSGGSGSSGGASGSSSGSSGSSSGGGNCPTCGPGNICCNGVACDIDSMNDPLNCGGCNVHCVAPDSFCAQGNCTTVPCGGQPCAAGLTCCGSQACCNAGDICCTFEGPQDYVGCYTPTAQQPSCPPGCPACVSDRNVKRDVTPVDPQAVLEGLARLPVATWSYRTDDPSVKHMGPMAQELYAEFGLGNTDKAYSPVDANGLAFAAIQGLYERMQEQQARIEKLERENAELRERKGAR